MVQVEDQVVILQLVVVQATHPQLLFHKVMMVELAVHLIQLIQVVAVEVQEQ